MHQSRPPLWHGKHYSPTRGSDGFLSSDGHLDFIKLLVNPLLIMAIEVKLLEDSQRFLVPIRFHEMARGLREEKDSEGQYASWDGLKGER
jgi:hypothetical protein